MHNNRVKMRVRLRVRVSVSVVNKHICKKKERKKFDCKPYTHIRCTVNGWSRRESGIHTATHAEIHSAFNEKRIYTYMHHTHYMYYGMWYVAKQRGRFTVTSEKNGIDIGKCVGAIRYSTAISAHTTHYTKTYRLDFSHLLTCSHMLNQLFFPRALVRFLSSSFTRVMVRGMCVCSTCEPIFRSGVYFVWKVCYRVQSCTHTAHTHLWFSVRSCFAK